MIHISHDAMVAFFLVHIDDPYILRSDTENKYRNLQKLLSMVQESLLYLTPMNCEFFKVKNDFLGRHIG